METKLLLTHRETEQKCYTRMLRFTSPLCLAKKGTQPTPEIAIR